MTNQSSIVRTVLAASVSMAALAAVGCSSQSPPPPYPTPSTDTTGGAMGTSLKVPAGATLIAASGYPIAPFTPPGDGTVYVYDADNNTIPLVTSGVAGKTMDLATMQSANSTLNPKHQFRIYFVPARMATTTSAPLGS